MKYSSQIIIKRFESGEKLKFLFFWGHQKSDIVTKSCFSQWYEVDFTIDGVKYLTAEHWMMAEKARLFNDIEIYQQIISSTHSHKAKSLGRKIKNFNQEIWHKHRFDIVVKGNYSKFTQNKELADYLVNTKNRILVESSPIDTIWGVGLTKDSKLINNPTNWRGLNLLGYALMEVRDMIK